MTIDFHDILDEVKAEQEETGVDFSKLERPQEMPKADPLDIDDREYFAGKTIARDVIDILARPGRCLASGDHVLYGRSENDEDVEVLFCGARAELFRGGEIDRHLRALTYAHEDAGGAEADTLTGLIVEGVWEDRRWKDAKGTWHKRTVFRTARWQTNLGSTHAARFVEEGRLPRS